MILCKYTELKMYFLLVKSLHFLCN